jgi:class 3 adenylate cyclase
MKHLKTLLPLLCILTVIVSCTYSSPKKTPRIEKGVLDITHWDFAKDGTVPLDGDWEFYCNTFITPKESIAGIKQNPIFVKAPSEWNSYKIDGKTVGSIGYATYRVRILTSGTNQVYGIKMQECGTAYAMYVNGKLVGTNGIVGTSQRTMVPEYKPQVIYFTDSSTSLDVVVHISNYYHRVGGLWYTLEIGLPQQAAQLREGALYFELFLFGALIMAAILHLGLFILRRSDLSNLYFAVFCLLVAIRTFVTGENAFHTIAFTGADFGLYIRMEYISVYCVPPFFLMFINRLYPEEVKTFWVWALWAVMGTLIVIVAVTPSSFFSKQVNIFYLACAAAILVVIYGLIRASIRKKEGAILFIVGFGFFVSAFVNDMLLAKGIIQSRPMFALGAFVFIFSQSYIISQRFAFAYQRVERLTDYLKKTNIALELFVPTEFLKYLGKKSITEFRLGDQVQQEMIVLFCDIRSFTSISEKMTPEENFNFLNSYLRRMGPVIRSHGGFIDKYIGDAIMALFPSTPDMAIRAAVGMQQELSLYNQHRANSGYEPISIGIGLHAGKLIMGTIGEEGRMDTTVIADAVNLASRLEGLTKYYGASIIVSGELWDTVTDKNAFQHRVLDRVSVQGKTSPVVIVEILDGLTNAERNDKLATQNEYNEAVSSYVRGDVNAACHLFTKILEKTPHDKAVELYIGRCTKHIAVGLPENWDGVEKFDSK